MLNSTKKQAKLTDSIKEVLENPKDVENILESAKTLKNKIGKTNVALDEKLKIEYRLRLMDAVLSMMAKINSGKEANNG